MATKIVTKNSSTASAVPTASDLVQGELAVNVADKRLFTEDNAGAIVELGTNPTTLNVNGTATMDGLTVETSADPALITLRHTGNTSGLIIKNFSGGEAQLVNVDNGPMVFKTNDTERMRIDSSGNVGIGTSSPSAPLHVSGSDSTVPIKIDNTGTGGDTWRIWSTNDAASDGGGKLGFYNEDTATRAMTLDASGQVGIGTSSPTAKLTVSGTGVGAAIDWTNTTASTGRSYRWVSLNNGTGFAIEDLTAGTERMRIDSSGDLLVNTTSSGVWSNATQSVSDNGHSLRNDGIQGSAAYKTTANVGYVQYLNRTGSDGGITAFYKNGTTVGSIGTEGGRLQIGKGASGIYFYDSGPSVLPWNIGSNTSADNSIDLGSSGGRFKDLYLSGNCNTSRVFTDKDGDWGMEMKGATTARIRFHTSAGGTGQVGSITVSTSSTSYNTSSDYRLKENVVELTGATERLKQLNPSRFNFIADADTTVDGFLAHEVADVVPEAISGNKDAMKDEEYEVTPEVLDDDGNVITEAVIGTRSVPDYQGIDQSKLVPLLVATIQELEARITQLENN